MVWKITKILITGFEPFDGYSINPSAELATILNDTRINGFDLVGSVLPLDYTKAHSILKDLISKHKPKYVLCTGQANRSAITLEQVGLNVVNTKRADNYGNIPESYIIDDQAPAAYFSTIDVRRLVDAITENEIPADVSFHAGTYGCNWILFSVLNWISRGEVDTDALFIHVPPLPAQAIEKDTMTLATMPLKTIVDAVRILIESLE